MRWCVAPSVDVQDGGGVTARRDAALLLLAWSSSHCFTTSAVAALRSSVELQRVSLRQMKPEQQGQWCHCVSTSFF